MEQTLADWGFTPSADRLVWRGTIPGADRLRFVGMLSRYTALLADVHMENEDRDLATAAAMRN
jgi:ABC-2 type transport system ATP-binding protein